MKVIKSENGKWISFGNIKQLASVILWLTIDHCCKCLRFGFDLGLLLFALTKCIDSAMNTNV